MPKPHQPPANRQSHWLVDLAVILAVIAAGAYWYGGSAAVSGLFGWYFGGIASLLKGEPGAAAGAAFGVGGAIAVGLVVMLPIAIVFAIFRAAFGKRR